MPELPARPRRDITHEEDQCALMSSDTGRILVSHAIALSVSSRDLPGERWKVSIASSVRMLRSFHMPATPSEESHLRGMHIWLEVHKLLVRARGRMGEFKKDTLSRWLRSHVAVVDVDGDGIKPCTGGLSKKNVSLSRLP